MYIYTYVHIHVYIYTYTCTYICIHICNFHGYLPNYILQIYCFYIALTPQQSSEELCDLSTVPLAISNQSLTRCLSFPQST